MLRKVVAVVVGLLASWLVLTLLAGPYLTEDREPGYITAMRSDLRNLVIAQESYFHDYQQYFTDTSSYAEDLFTASVQVTITITAAKSDGGWSFHAVASHPYTAVTCALYVGEPPQPPAKVEGEVDCTRRKRGLQGKLRCALYGGSECW